MTATRIPSHTYLIDDIHAYCYASLFMLMGLLPMILVIVEYLKEKGGR
jgi:hypothetical protein